MQENLHPDRVVDGAAEARAVARRNLFMAATLHAADVATPVKIRDLSAAGAQVETPLLPAVGSLVTLSRGRLRIQGHVTWCTERRCGLHFSSQISVQDWMTNPVNHEQGRVDRAVAVVKSGAVPLAAVVSREARPVLPIADDLRQVSRLLELLGDALASDPALVTEHGTELQSLDLAVQTLTVLAETMDKGAPANAASIARLNELRVICGIALRARPQA